MISLVHNRGVLGVTSKQKMNGKPLVSDFTTEEETDHIFYYDLEIINSNFGCLRLASESGQTND